MLDTASDTSGVMPLPNTQESLSEEFARLGIEAGMILMVHSSLSAVGWTVGGAPSLIRALQSTLTPQGTLVMPAESPTISDPAGWQDPRIDPSWLDIIREQMPVFDRETTPTAMGIVPETFRNWPGTRRSDHPQVSVCANGPKAEEITREHSLAFAEGRGTPFEKLYDLDAWTLLLGVGFDRCTSLHFAESLVQGRRTKTSHFPILEYGRRVWIENLDMADDRGSHFPIVGEQYIAAGQARQGRIGEAFSVLFPTRHLVDFARSYFQRVL